MSVTEKERERREKTPWRSFVQFIGFSSLPLANFTFFSFNTSITIIYCFFPPFLSFLVLSFVNVCALRCGTCRDVFSVSFRVFDVFYECTVRESRTKLRWQSRKLCFLLSYLRARGFCFFNMFFFFVFFPYLREL